MQAKSELLYYALEAAEGPEHGHWRYQQSQLETIRMYAKGIEDLF